MLAFIKDSWLSQYYLLLFDSFLTLITSLLISYKLLFKSEHLLFIY